MSRRSSLQVAAATPPASPLRERIRKEMAAGMLLAAEDVFAESGLAKAHVEDIARRAGVAVGTLYNYYKDRDGLLAAVLTARIEELTEELDVSASQTAGRPVRAALLDLVRTYFRFVIRRTTFVRILAEGELTQLRDAYPTSATLPTRSAQRFRDVVGAVLARGVAEGSVSPVDPDLDLWLFVGLLRGVVLRHLRGGASVRESDADRVVDVFFDGVRV